MSKKRVLITGGAGFIGSNLAAACSSEEFDVDIVDNLRSGHTQFIPKHLLSNFYFRDFSSQETLHDVASGKYDIVFHLAAIPRVSYSVEFPFETNDVNVTKTLLLLNACKGNIKRFVFASSSSVYGGAEVLPTPTTYPKTPKSPYALQKSIIEDYLRVYYELYGLDSVCLRYFNVFGPKQLGGSPYSTVVSAWINAVLSGNSIRFDGDGSQSRDMCYVSNVVDACIKSSKVSGKLKAEPLNVACGEKVTNKQILEYFLKRYPNAKYYEAPWRQGDVMHSRADITRTIELIGYDPKIKFWDGLEKTIAWNEENFQLINGLNK